MHVIVSKFALLEAEFLLRRSVTIVRDTYAINSSRTKCDDTEYGYQCMIETLAFQNKTTHDPQCEDGVIPRRGLNNHTRTYRSMDVDFILTIFKR